MLDLLHPGNPRMLFLELAVPVSKDFPWTASNRDGYKGDGSHVAELALSCCDGLKASQT